MFRYVRFTHREFCSDSPPLYAIVKTFHFSAGGQEQIMVLDGTPFEHDFEDPHMVSKTVPLEEATLLAPVLPSKIIGIGLNYKDHAAEQGKPLPEIPYVFLIAVSSLEGPSSVIRLNKHCTEVHYEAELAVVIGRDCSNVSEAEALDYVCGYMIGNDVTDRTIQKKELTFARAKGMDTFCPVGPYLVRGIDWKNRAIRTWINGELKQDGNTNDMIHSVPAVVSFVSQFMTLFPGDIILTGTPAGVGPIKAGDKIRIEIDELGALENAVER